MTVARLWSGDIYKGVDVTIRALPKVAQDEQEVKYLVIGRGDDRPRLEKLAQDLGVGDRIIFAGFVPTEELVDHYRLADAYIMPSQEGFGIVYLEAMACGVPVLAGDGDGSADPLQLAGASPRPGSDGGGLYRNPERRGYKMRWGVVATRGDRGLWERGLHQAISRTARFFAQDTQPCSRRI